MATAGSSSQGRTDIWNLPEIISYFQADAEIKDALTEGDFKNLVNYESDWVKLVRTALEYQGFDPRVVLSQMIRNKKSYDAQAPEEVKWDLCDLTNVGDDLRWKPDSKAANKFTNKDSLVKDVNFLITVFLSRNNHIDKILKKSRGGVEDILNMLKEKYAINDDVHSSGTTLGSRTITLPRIAGVFPATAVRMFHDKVVKEIVSYDSFPGTIRPDTHAICCPLLPSVAPQSIMKSKGGNFHAAMIWATIKLDDIIHRKDGSFTNLMDVLSYYRAGYQSAATPEGARIKVFQHLGLVEDAKDTSKTASLTLSSAAQALCASCISALGQMRTTDEGHDLLMKVVKTGDLDLF